MSKEGSLRWFGWLQCILLELGVGWLGEESRFEWGEKGLRNNHSKK